MQTTAIVLEEPGRIDLRRLGLADHGKQDVSVAVEWTGISTGTERLLYDGTMPMFPGMGYPLVPGYEAVGRVVRGDANGTYAIGQSVFVPGATCFEGARGLFGASASHLVVPTARIVPVDPCLGETAVLLALAATAYHTFAATSDAAPELIVGHGVLGRLLARIAMATGAPAPTVWETNSARAEGAEGYLVLNPTDDPRRDYRVVTDVSGDSTILDSLIDRLAPGGEIVLAGFYKEPLSFVFPPAFMREARMRVAAQWQRSDLEYVNSLITNRKLSLDGLVTHRADASRAGAAYPIAFGDPACLKMALDWRDLS